MKGNSNLNIANIETRDVMDNELFCDVKGYSFNTLTSEHPVRRMAYSTAKIELNCKQIELPVQFKTAALLTNLISRLKSSVYLEIQTVPFTIINFDDSALSLSTERRSAITLFHLGNESTTIEKSINYSNFFLLMVKMAGC